VKIRQDLNIDFFFTITILSLSEKYKSVRLTSTQNILPAEAQRKSQVVSHLNLVTSILKKIKNVSVMLIILIKEDFALGQIISMILPK